MLIETRLSGEGILVDPLSDEFVLDLIRDSEVQERQAGRRKIRFAVVWAERHVAADVLRAAHWSDASRDRGLRDVEERIGGEGTPMVAAACVPSFATALGISTGSAMQLLSDALDLKHRLPRIGRRMDTLAVAPWRARRIAKLTHHLCAEAARYVDEQLAPVADSCGVARIDRLVGEAIAMFDAVQQQVLEDQAQAAWGVRLDHYTGPVWSGTSRLEIIGDTPTLTRFSDLLSAKAHADLDSSTPTEERASLEHRKVAALGAIADGAGATSTTRLYAHLELTDLTDELVRLGTVERLGPLTVARIKDLLGSSTVCTIVPVLHLHRDDAVNQHDPPEWMREVVMLRDPTCVFPGCDQDSRHCDLDHIEAYVEIDDRGPPGQTRPDNLAPLCRSHHRAKTFHGWAYVRNTDGSHTWTDPHDNRFTVDPRGIVTRH